MKCWRGPKQGFALPLVHRMRHQLKDLIIATPTEPRTQQRRCFRAKGIRRLFDQHFQGRRDQSVRIWRLLMLELRFRNFLEARPFEHDQAEMAMGEAFDPTNG